MRCKNATLVKRKSRQRVGEQDGVVVRAICELSSLLVLVLAPRVEPKTKVINLANDNRCRQSNEPIKRHRRHGWENACEQATIGFGFTA